MKYYLKFYNPEYDVKEEYEHSIGPIPVPDGLSTFVADKAALKFIHDESPLRNLIPLILWRDEALTDVVKDWGEQFQLKFNSLRKQHMYVIEELQSLKDT